MTTRFVTPVGRFVSGDVFKPQPVTDDNKQQKIDAAGNPIFQYFMAVAFEKTNPDWPAFYQMLCAEAQQSHRPPFDAAGNLIFPTFAFKISDGDGANKYGDLNSAKDGWAGCWVVKFTTQFAPKAYTAGGASVINDPMAIKRGYFVRVSGSCKPNTSKESPGIYVNHDMIELIGYGPEIVGGPDASETFGAAPATYTPAGMSAAPVAPATTPAPPAAAMAPPAAAMAPPAAAMAPPAAAMAPPAAAMAPPAPPAAAVAPPPPEKVWVPALTAKATTEGQTYDGLKAAGWSDTLMFQHGYIVEDCPF